MEERNEVAEEMMQRALAARERKKQETEDARRKADGFGGGLKKGFLSKAQANWRDVYGGDEGFLLMDFLLHDGFLFGGGYSKMMMMMMMMVM